MAIVNLADNAAASATIYARLLILCPLTKPRSCDGESRIEAQLRFESSLLSEDNRNDVRLFGEHLLINIFDILYEAVCSSIFCKQCLLNIALAPARPGDLQTCRFA